MPGRVPPRRLSPRETDEGDRLLRPKGPPLANRTQPGGRGRAGARAPGPGAGPERRISTPLASPRVPRYVSGASRDQTVPDPLTLLRGWGNRAKLACGPGSRVPRSADPRPYQVPSRHRCHPQTACLLFFFFFLIDSQKNLGPQRSPPCPSPRRHHHPLGAAPTPPSSPHHLELEVGSDWPGLEFQRLPSCFEPVIKLLDMLIFLPKNVH